MTETDSHTGRDNDNTRPTTLDHHVTRAPHGTPASTTSKENNMPATVPELDVRQEIPARRHELIFATYGALAPGESFILVNDHDPKPLYYQLAAEHTGQFEWAYLEGGPNVWKVQIGRVATV